MQQQAEPPASLQQGEFRIATYLGGGFLLCLLCITIFTAVDFTSGAKLETFSETTAAGDKNYFKLPTSGEPVFLWQTRHYVLASREKVKIDDTDMVRVGREETGDYVFYTPKTGSGKVLYVKTDVGEFLSVRLR